MIGGAAAPRTWLAALALAGLPAAALSAQPAPAGQADSLVQAKAMKLAQVVQPRERVVDRSMIILDRDFVPALLRDPDVKQLEVDHPGILTAMWTAGRPVIRDLLYADMPNLWEKLASVYAKGLTGTQLDEVAAFFAGPTGQAFLAGMMAETDITPIADEVMRNDGTVGTETYTRTVQTAGIGAAAALTAEQRAEFLAFFSTPAGKALIPLAPEVSRSVVEWMNREDSGGQARVNAAMSGAAEAFIAAEGSKPSPDR